MWPTRHARGAIDASPPTLTYELSIASRVCIFSWSGAIDASPPTLTYVLSIAPRVRIFSWSRAIDASPPHRLILIPHHRTTTSSSPPQPHPYDASPRAARTRHVNNC